MYGVRNGHKEASLVCTTVVENLHIYIEKLKLEKSTSYFTHWHWIFSTDFFSDFLCNFAVVGTDFYPTNLNPNMKFMLKQNISWLLMKSGKRYQRGSWIFLKLDTVAWINARLNTTATLLT